jgi:hypothetical protein
MTGARATAAALLAGILAGGAPAIAGQGARAPDISGPPAAAAGAYQLTAEIPATIRRGAVVTLILHVRKGGRPVDRTAACLAAVPLFMSVEDALDPTPAGGIDLGPGADSAVQPACTMAIAGVPSGPGTYAFTWEPDTPGRVNLTFRAADSTLTVPIDVAGAPPSAAILTFFVVLLVVILSTATWMRRRPRSEGAAS